MDEMNKIIESNEWMNEWNECIEWNQRSEWNERSQWNEQSEWNEWINEINKIK